MEPRSDIKRLVGESVMKRPPDPKEFAEMLEENAELRALENGRIRITGPCSAIAVVIMLATTLFLVSGGYWTVMMQELPALTYAFTLLWFASLLLAISACSSWVLHRQKLKTLREWMNRK